MKQPRRSRLVASDGHDFPAWAVGTSVVFKLDAERTYEGRQWCVVDTRIPRMAETTNYEEAVRIANVWDEGGHIAEEFEQAGGRTDGMD